MRPPYDDGESADGLGLPWVELPYDDAWRGFAERFSFRPHYLERPPAGVRDPGLGRESFAAPPDSLVLDLSAVFASDPAGFGAGAASVEASTLRVLVALVGEGEVHALDWQHPAYRYAPSRLARSGLRLPVPVFPNGDYYVHTPPDLRWGTFGHPWAQTLTLWGSELVGTLGVELATWLPVLRRGS